MKKIILSLMLLSILVGANAQRNIVKTSPLDLAFGNFNATYEWVLNPSSSLLFSGNFAYKFLWMDITMGGVGAGYRYYITHAKKAVPNGFYVNPQVGFGFGSAKRDNGEKVQATAFGFGAELGYQWVWNSGFTLDLGIGPRYEIVNKVNKGGSNQSNHPAYNSVFMPSANNSGKSGGFTPSVTVAIGYAF